MKKVFKYTFISLVATTLVLTAFGFYSAKADNSDSADNQATTTESTSSIEASAVETSTVEISTVVENNNAKENKSKAGSPSFSITPNSKVDARGVKVVSISGNNLNLSVFGLSLNAVFSSSTSLIGAPSSNLSQIKAGDILQIQGEISPASGVISINQVRDESLTSINISSIQARIQALLQELKKLQAQYGLPQGLLNNPGKGNN